MKWIQIGLLVTVAISVLLLVFKPRAAGPLETTGKSVSEIVAEVEERASSFTNNPLAWALCRDGGLSEKVRDLSRKADRKKNQTGPDARKVILEAAEVDKWVYMRIKPLDFHIPIIIAGLFFACFGMLGVWAGVPKNGTMAILMGCAAPAITGEIPAFAISIPIFIIAILHGLLGGRRFEGVVGR